MTKPKIEPDEIPKREPKKKTAGANFANIRLEPHPASVLFGLTQPAEQQPETQLAIQPASLPNTQLASDVAIQQAGLPESQLPGTPDAQPANYPETEDFAAVEKLVSPASRIPKVASQLDQPESWEAGKLASQTPSLTTLTESRYPSRKLRRQKNLRLPVQKLEAYEMWCFVHKIDFQDAVERAMDWLTSQPASRMMINESDEGDDIESSSIARFYENWTGNKWNAKDREALKELADIEPGVIQCGIMISVIRRAMAADGQKINSFRYCFGAIRETAAAGIGDPATYMKSLRRYAEKEKIQPKE